MAQTLPDAPQLLKQNCEWAKANAHLHPEIAGGQCPKVLWLGCSDSRVPESVITSALPGHIFVHRNIGNVYSQTDDSFHSVLEFSLFDPTAPESGISVSDIVVVGHTNCGAIQASLDLASGGDGNISDDATPLRRWLAPIVQLAGTLPNPTVETLTEANIREQVKLIAASRTVARDLTLRRTEKQPVTIRGWLHDLSTGRLREICVVEDPNVPILKDVETEHD